VSPIAAATEPLAKAAVSGALPKAGVVALAGLVGVILLSRSPRTRAGAVLAALVLSPVLLLADIWHSKQLGVLHRHPLPAVVGVALLAVLLVALAAAIGRRPWLIAPLVIVALPFRIPIEAGGKTSNLLVPLYFVVGAGALAYALPALRPGGRLGAAPPPTTAPGERGAVVWVARLLALYIALYALQSLYSKDFEIALQQMVFFYVPFALLLFLLAGVRWDPLLLRRCLILVAGLAVVFALVAFVEYATKTIILPNPKLVAQNDLHTYFTVNSFFYDPDIFGRFLALVMILLVAVLLYSRRQRDQLTAAAVLVVLWAGLVLTLSRSSLSALVVGMATLAALRWRVKPVLAVAAAILLTGAVAVAISPNTFGLNQGLNGASSGRTGLVTGGLKMFSQRPVWGYGPGAFVTEYRAQHPNISTNLAASHTIAVTVAAEQGLIGELAYVAFVVAALAMLMRGARASPARAAVAAAFLALVFHTQLYADFLEDPVTWALLGIGFALTQAPVMVSTRPADADPVRALAA
jgi:putative inorganic carbon (hco3(-)) transporter